ncbi:TIGR04076 family protein [Caproiciproducens galactitolivorans]|uniref:TIGR04076 family protein n=1 Tax=Caproiciproducens galactitolivorans TaxID=642589 RepID=A0ABT4BW71_9FIRM|nr:TIGR04076 family protein [Caproiciproducens galactitolivorans]MCY1715134.1 TIGR04076 family protein [Caproiciproducens galactitolivorans]
MKENKIKLVVVQSNCPLYKEGDSIYFDGALIDKEKSGNLCMTALSAVFPFVYAARKGVVKESSLQCPDCRESVEFSIQVDDSEEEADRI